MPTYRLQLDATKVGLGQRQSRIGWIATHRLRGSLEHTLTREAHQIVRPLIARDGLMALLALIFTVTTGGLILYHLL